VHDPSSPPDVRSDRPTLAKEVDVASLVGSGREVILVHRGERYRLRITANGKLILTK
jgi:hemin uptake protein HemP